ncbi:uncharacterized protein AMSG_03746 [Thecamonas trahens ATCC 50062]|uniref:UspA domain-containing protein n=1 Tax=Thecamonas trahens ATCC 50062 TaxID=461836 RepID=A0A0L0D4M6_THETB|nr:hypothetical protein AMSG_03746 [Thecamonas trahens ATCC 50062]KNC47312.1 hypothetical protein AMSG_03746 [Thecamonas trahens ATCC 50062]|eukprot:XP_013759653.1 hypothetical protein AMSG_03746 [Thecamonas trahens ATCC 50062]
MADNTQSSYRWDPELVETGGRHVAIALDASPHSRTALSSALVVLRKDADRLTLIMVLHHKHGLVAKALQATGLAHDNVHPLADEQDYADFLVAFKDAAGIGRPYPTANLTGDEADDAVFAGEALDAAVDSGFDAVLDVIISSKPKNALLDYAERSRANAARCPGGDECVRPGFVHDPIDLLVLGSRGRSGISSWLLGSVSASLAKLAPLPTMIAKAPLPYDVACNDGPAKWMVAMDMRPEGFPSSLRAVASLVPIIRPDDTLILLSVLSVEEAVGVSDDQYEKRPAKALFNSLPAVLADYGITARTEFQVGHPGSQICAVADAEGIDVLALGCRDSTADGMFALGSVSQHVVTHAEVPVVWISK